MVPPAASRFIFGAAPFVKEGIKRLYDNLAPRFLKAFQRANILSDLPKRTIKLSSAAHTRPVDQRAAPTAPAPTIEHACWYIDWTSWDHPIPENVNMIHIFVGKLDVVDGHPSVSGFGTFNNENMKEFVQQCNAKGIKVKISIGGGGGQYDYCWDQLTDTNVGDYAQGLVNFCDEMGLAGVDFDYEEAGSPELHARVGTLIREFKTRAPDLQASYCTNASFPGWSDRAKTLLDATIDPQTGKSLLDRFYVMSYYNPIDSEQQWLTQWLEWLIKEYNFSPAQLSAGLDDTDAHAYNIADLAKWAAQMGISTGYWECDPNTIAQSNASLHAILQAYNSVSAPPPYTLLPEEQPHLIMRFLTALWNLICAPFRLIANLFRADEAPPPYAADPSTPEKCPTPEPPPPYAADPSTPEKCRTPEPPPPYALKG